MILTTKTKNMDGGVKRKIERINFIFFLFFYNKKKK
jgi:hypothetical protein